MRIFNELFILVYYWWYVFTLVLLMINERQAKMYKPIWQCLMCMFYLICDIIIFKEIYRFFRKIYRFSYRFLIKNRIFWNGYTDFPKFQVVMSAIMSNFKNYARWEPVFLHLPLTSVQISAFRILFS